MKKEMTNQEILYRRQQIITGALISVIVVMVLIPIAWYYSIKIEGRIALREAKNVKMAFEMVSIEGYGADTTIFDEKQPTGIKEEYLKDVMTLSHADGDVTIKKWDLDDGKVEKFTYRTGNYTVYYSLNDKDEPSWDIDYTIRVLKFE